jgi:hypothetical protein
MAYISTSRESHAAVSKHEDVAEIQLSSIGQRLSNDCPLRMTQHALTKWRPLGRECAPLCQRGLVFVCKLGE